MNKKRLSVVMAGAMLASSVAPVLAAEVVKSEHSANELGLLQKELRELINSKVFANEKVNGDLKGKSVYAIYVDKTLAKDANGDALDVDSSQEDWQSVFNNIKAGSLVEIYSKGFREEEKDGKKYYYHHEANKKVETYKTAAELETVAKSFYKNGDDMGSTDDSKKGRAYTGLIEFATYDNIRKETTIKFKNDTSIPDSDNADTVVLGIGSVKLVNNTSGIKKYIKADGTEDSISSNVTPKDFYGFVLSETEEPAAEISSEKIREITITPGGYDLALEDLYDGLMLTEKGHEFFQMVEDEVVSGRKVLVKITDEEGQVYTVDTIDLSKQWTAEFENIYNRLKKYESGYRFQVVLKERKLSDDIKLAEEVYTITGKDKTNTARVADWLRNAQARVDILAGSNRYETAANIARKYARLTTVGNRTTTSVGKDANIVLVNGDALVDGLAAAPLAATKTNKVGSENISAPILLTEADALPKATKAYLKEVLKNVEIGALNKVTIHLVGGKTVLNMSLERELERLGFDVERYGGENREETSLEVAEAMGKKGETFVVGADGEADAMSIASVAASTKTPIIVAKRGGISEDALHELREKVVTVVGGKSVVSEAEYNEIKAEANGILRVHGSNRQATNAEVIKRYYKVNYVGTAKNVVVAKDGQNNKSELIDALAAANLASEKKAPIVLATNKISKAQEDALELNAKNSYALYQVGYGVNRNVVKTIAENLGLADR